MAATQRKERIKPSVNGPQGHLISKCVIFFLWGHIKDIIYKPQLPANINDLKTAIRRAVRSIPTDTLELFWEELERRLRNCRALKGTHVDCT